MEQLPDGDAAQARELQDAGTNLLYKAKGVKILDGQHLQPEVLKCQEKRRAQGGCTCEKHRARGPGGGEDAAAGPMAAEPAQEEGGKAEGGLEKGCILRRGSGDRPGLRARRLGPRQAPAPGGERTLSHSAQRLVQGSGRMGRRAFRAGEGLIHI